MNDETQPPAEQEPLRCPNCDSVVAAGAQRCLMCGEALPQTAASKPDPQPAPPVKAVPEPKAQPETAVSQPQPLPPASTPSPKQPATGGRSRWRPTPLFLAALGMLGIVLILVAAFLRMQDDATPVAQVGAGTETAVPPTNTAAATWTPLPTQTSRPTATPTITPTPQPTATLQPPRLHIVTSGETLIGLASFYRVSVDSIVAENDLSGPNAIQVNQQLLVPWPTPTPPLEPVAQEVNGELVIADPTDCERYTAAEGDSLSGIAARFDVDFALFLEVNRLTTEYVLQPGDSLCIPRIIYGASLPPTPGPSPTPTMTPPPRGPELLYPVNNATVQPPDGVLTLQWAVVKTLAADEQYMVELLDTDEANPIPLRGFTRATSFQVPNGWRPTVAATHQIRWRVAIVQVTDTRSDGLPIYTYGGETSAPSFFFWEGAVPTPTPTHTPTPAPTATPTPTE